MTKDEYVYSVLLNRHEHFESNCYLYWSFWPYASQLGGKNPNYITHFAGLLSKDSHIHVFMHTWSFCKVFHWKGVKYKQLLSLFLLFTALFSICIASTSCCTEFCPYEVVYAGWQWPSVVPTKVATEPTNQPSVGNSSEVPTTKEVYIDK